MQQKPGGKQINGNNIVIPQVTKSKSEFWYPREWPWAPVLKVLVQKGLVCGRFGWMDGWVRVLHPFHHDAIQHGQPDVITFQDGWPDVIQDGGHDVMSFKMADWLWCQEEQKTWIHVIAPPCFILLRWVQMSKSPAMCYNLKCSLKQWRCSILMPACLHRLLKTKRCNKNQEENKLMAIILLFHR